MSKITSVEPQVKDKTRVNIYVDGRFYCGMKLETAIKFHLKSGMEVDEASLDEIQLESEKSEALDRAFEHLSASVKTEKQMRDYLVKKGYVPSVVEYCMEKLRYYGYVNDEEYCRAYVSGTSGKGRRALVAALKKRGADERAIEESLSDYEDDEEEMLAVLRKYMRGKTCDRQGMYKAYKYLVSKGYGYDAAKQAAERYGNENDTSEEC